MLDQVDPDRPNPGIRIPFQTINDTVSTQMFWDSDFGKSIEAAAYGLLRKPDAKLEARIDDIVDAYERLQDIALRVNGEPFDLLAHTENGYARITRLWRAGDRVELDIDMPVHRLYAHPKVGVDQGRVALQRGPLVYCLEGADNGDSLNSIVLDAQAGFRCEPVEALAGAQALVTNGIRETVPENHLYGIEAPRSSATEVRAVPYYAWDNRAPGEMLVWVRQEQGR